MKLTARLFDLFDNPRSVREEGVALNDLKMMCVRCDPYSVYAKTVRISVGVGLIRIVL